MKKILIFAGTTEGRRLSECLSAAGIRHTVCVATEYGEIVLKEQPCMVVHRGRMEPEEMREFICREAFDAVVDATHPYAQIVTENIKTAMEGMKTPLFRLQRETTEEDPEGELCYFEDSASCAAALEKTEGNILLTTGSKELAAFCTGEDMKRRLYVRILPGMESLQICMDQGICGKQILALQGPFGTEMNEAMLRQYQIRYLVTKNSGRTGGYREKLEAAGRVGIPVYVIGQRQKQEGASFQQVCSSLEKICDTRIDCRSEYEIILAGTGMGSREDLTQEVNRAIENADILLGAQRLIENYQPAWEKKPYYTAAQILPYLKSLQERTLMKERVRVVILFSGDSGFYSGCQALYQSIRQEIRQQGLKASLCILPGISCVSYLAACIGESYQDAAICSIHGKEVPNLMEQIRKNRKLFLLVSKAEELPELGQKMIAAGLQECRITVGYRLSYPEQRIERLTPEQCIESREQGLAVCLIQNPCPVQPGLTPGKADAEFIRDKVPMTKEEIREVGICKLKLKPGAVVYDIGSGTGSVAAEIAALSASIKVWAMERKAEAVSLIRKNREQFRLDNLEVVEGETPECMGKLPVPTHVFIGGSNGRMMDILDALYEKNPQLRVVLTAVSLETVSEMKQILDRYPMQEEELVQLQVSRADRLGRYHMMKAENPVWICAFTFQKGSDT